MISDRQKQVKIVYIVYFIGLISLPLIGLIFNIGNLNLEEFRGKEKRDPSKYPKLPMSIEALKKFPSDFETAFNDQLPFRDYFIKIYSRLSINLLRVSPHSQLVIGKNGHCFLGSHGNGDNDLIFSSIEINPKRVQRVTATLREKEAFLEDLGIPALLVAIPTSPLFEFQNLPSYLQKKIDPSFLKMPPAQHIINHISKDFSQKYLLYPYERALAANDEYPLFPKKNFHWTTSRFTKLTASCIAERFKIAPYEKPGMDEFVIKDTKSDLSGLAGISIYNRDDIVYKEGTWEKLNIHEGKIKERYRNFSNLHWIGYTVNTSKRGKILLVGDSFTPALRFDMARYFGEVFSINFNLIRKHPDLPEWFKCMFDDVRPDYIVFICHNNFRIFDEFIENFYLVKK